MSDADRLEQQADQAAAARRFGPAAALLGQAVAVAPARPELWSKLSAMRRASGDAPGALAAIEQGLALSPLDFTALLARAMLLELVRPEAAGEAFCEALAQLPPEGSIPPALAAPIDHARVQSARHREAVEARLRSAVTTTAQGNRIDRFISNSARRTRHFHQEPSHFHFPGLPEREFHDLAAFPKIAGLAERTDAIRAEFRALLAAEQGGLVPYIQYPDRVPLRQWQALNRNPAWSALHLLQNGSRIEANARHCPQTLAALAALDQPDVPGASPNAMFSLLAPRTRIPPHSGVANTRLVCHLPLIVPPGCGFRCGATSVEWQVGTPFVFDDTIEHEAWNDSDSLRVVMIFDLWVPDLSPAERAAVAAIIPAWGADSAL